jgi:hypothetical protein
MPSNLKIAQNTASAEANALVGTFTNGALLNIDNGTQSATPKTAVVTLRVKHPDTIVVIHNYPGDITRDGTGQYHSDLSITESGDWYDRFEGTGILRVARETLFHVSSSNVI